MNSFSERVVGGRMCGTLRLPVRVGGIILRGLYGPVRSTHGYRTHWEMSQVPQHLTYL
jgi:hypothetical protein